jgi:hypothetical protein
LRHLLIFRRRANHFNFLCAPLPGSREKLKTAAPNRDFPEPFQSALPHRPLHNKNLTSVFPKNMFVSPIPIRQRGASRSSRVLERDAVDATLSPDVRRGSGRRNRVVLVPRRWDQALRDVTQGDGG